MTIVSKLDKARGIFVDAVKDAAAVLATPRATAEARAELNEARRESVEKGCCAYCGKELGLKRNLRHTEACMDCGKLIDRMLMQKSNVVNNTESVEVLKALLKSYTDCSFRDKLPYALRGVTGDVQDVINALSRAVDAYSIYRKEYKAQRAREAEVYVEEARRKSILDLLVQCGADPNSEETLRRVDEIYYGE